MLKNQHSFSIENKLAPEEQGPFGLEYTGQFTVRRPTLGDKKAIALKDAASMSVYGPVDMQAVGEGTKLLSYIVTFVTHVSEGVLPPWFSLDKLYSEKDEAAIMAVWEEVTAFIDTFRPRKAGGAGGEPTGEFTPVVPEKV